MKTKEIEIKNLLEHEEIDSKAVEKIKSTLLSQRFVPIVVTNAGKNKYVILDGHHRFNALKKLGAKKAPCIVVNYEEVELSYWRSEYNYVKRQDVILAALSGKRFPIKTTRHMFNFNQEDYTVNPSKLLSTKNLG
jgi:ParB-like chromosome segregation protein Spo0J